MLDFSARRSLVSFVTAPERRSSFYRTLYKLAPQEGVRDIQSEEDWESLPFITKDMLSDVPLRERSFLPLSQVDYLGTSSGTSGRPPLFTPRSDVHNVDYRLDYHDFKKSVLSYLVPIMPHLQEAFARERGVSQKTTIFDPAQPDMSVRLARIAGTDAISVFAHHMEAIGEAMKREGINDSIRFIEITGGNCSRALYDYMHVTFPHAVILISYGAMEIDDAPSVGMPCKPIDGSEPLSVYHAKESHYLEILDPETQKNLEPTPGTEGDLIITAYRGEGATFPLVRYRIGDRVRIIEKKCPHGALSFTVLGRTEMDFIKVQGGVLRADEIARVLRLFPQRVSDVFQLRYHFTKTQSGPVLEPKLYVQTRGDIDLEMLARDIENKLRVGPSLTYAEGVKNGRFLPFRCAQLETDGSLQKHKWIVQCEQSS